MDFLRSFPRGLFAGKPVVASQNGSWFLRLPLKSIRKVCYHKPQRRNSSNLWILLMKFNVWSFSKLFQWYFHSSIFEKVIWLFSSFTFCSLESEKRVDANMLKMLNKLLDIVWVWLKYLFVFFLMLFYGTEKYWHITETKNTDWYNYTIQQRMKLAVTWNNWGQELMSSCWGLV